MTMFIQTLFPQQNMAVDEQLADIIAKGRQRKCVFGTYAGKAHPLQVGVAT